MRISPTIERKLADWTSTFDLIPDKQNQEAQALRYLISELQYVRKEEL